MILQFYNFTFNKITASQYPKKHKGVILKISSKSVDPP